MKNKLFLIAILASGSVFASLSPVSLVTPISPGSRSEGSVGPRSVDDLTGVSGRVVAPEGFDAVNSALAFRRTEVGPDTQNRFDTADSARNFTEEDVQAVEKAGQIGTGWLKG